MTFGEDLHLEGRLSPRLLRGMEEYQRIQCRWKPTFFRPVDIVPDQLEPSATAPRVCGVASSFSGGVDSHFTLWRHLPENEPVQEYQITHCLMINGFDVDIDLHDEGHFSRIQRSIEPMLARHGVELIVCRTNYMSFSDPNILKQSFGAMLVSPALVLGRLLHRFYVPASYRFDEFFRDGSHLLLDHFISTESMETIHDSSDLMRPEKTEVVSNWDATYSTLRVCFRRTRFRQDTGTIVNCGICEKCVRTMKTLEIFGRLDRYATFDRVPSHFNVWTRYYGHAGSRLHAREILSQAWKAGRLGIWIDFCIAIAISLLTKMPRDLLRQVHLVLEERSEAYAANIRRLLPRLNKQARWLR
jgi:hypothetical protein